MSKLSGFHTLGLNSHLLRAVQDAGYITPTPIQTQTIPPILEGRDLVGCAQTGTGKTAAFALPILQLLDSTQIESKPKKHNRNSQKKKPIRVLILSPTRELAIQIGDSFSIYSKFIRNLANTVIFGGVKAHSQIKALQAGVDVLVATPGRLLDLIGQGYISLDKVEILVFDEADRMLDMGFIHDVRRIMRNITNDHQTVLFSATMPNEIVQLARDFLQDPVRISVSPDKPTVDLIDQAIYFVSKNGKLALLKKLLKDPDVVRVLVFSRTKHGANKIVKKLSQAGFVAEPIHGNKSQNARQKALLNFSEGITRILVATDVAARGIDVEDISHVIQFDLPNESETYVHRIGRTGRAGAGGIAIGFCSDVERPFLKDIQKLIRMKIPVIENLIPKDSPQLESESVHPSRKSNSRNLSKQKNGSDSSKKDGKSRPKRLPKPKSQSMAINSSKQRVVSRSGSQADFRNFSQTSCSSLKKTPPIACPHCSRKFWDERAVSQHINSKHKNQSSL